MRNTKSNALLLAVGGFSMSLVLFLTGLQVMHSKTPEPEPGHYFGVAFFPVLFTILSLISLRTYLLAKNDDAG